MAAYEFTPGGIKSLDLDATATPVAAAPAMVNPATASAPQARPVEATPAPAPTRALVTLKPREYRKDLTARLKEVQNALKALARLQAEEAQIKRLLKALKAPTGTVRNINTARNAG